MAAERYNNNDVVDEKKLCVNYHLKNNPTGSIHMSEKDR